MKILVLNGSPHLNGSTSDMVNAFIWIRQKPEELKSIGGRNR